MDERGPHGGRPTAEDERGRAEAEDDRRRPRVRKATARACGPRTRGPRAPLGRARLWATRACGQAWLQGAVFFPFLILRYIVYKCIYLYKYIYKCIQCKKYTI